MEASEGGRACRSRLVVHKCTITLGDEKHAFDIGGRVLREVVLEIHHTRTGWEVAHPEGVAGLLRLSGWSTGVIRRSRD